MGLNLNPANWSIVNSVQDKLGQINNAANSFQGSGQAVNGGAPVYTTSPKSNTGVLGAQTGTGIYSPGPQLGNQFKTNVDGGAAAKVDPYAKYGGASAYNSLMSSFGNQKNNIFGTANDAAENSGIGYKNSILDFVDQLRSGQGQIDERGIQADLAKKQGVNSILDMVGRGIRSGGVLLANKNAGDSSAAGAIAQAYGDVGRRELSGVGNQYEQEQRAIQMSQDELAQQQASGQRKLGDSKTQIVNNIVSEARNSLAALDAQIAQADLPTRIAIEQEKNSIKDSVMGKLSQYDSLLAQETSKIAPKSAEQRRAEAYELANSGVAADNSFNFSNEAPVQFQQTGPFAGDLPLFSLPRGRDERTA